MEDRIINYQKYNLGSAKIYFADYIYNGKIVRFRSREKSELKEKIQNYENRSLATRVVDKLLKPSREFSSFFIKKIGEFVKQNEFLMSKPKQTNKQTNNSLISCSIA